MVSSTDWVSSCGSVVAAATIGEASCASSSSNALLLPVRHPADGGEAEMAQPLKR